LQCSEISKRGHPACVQDFERFHPDFDASRRHVGVFRPRRAGFDDAGHFNDGFAAQPLALGKNIFALRVEHQLDQPFAVPQVDEEHPAVVPPVVDPTREGDRFFDVLRPHLAAIKGSFHDGFSAAIVSKTAVAARARGTSRWAPARRSLRITVCFFNSSSPTNTTHGRAPTVGRAKLGLETFARGADLDGQGRGFPQAPPAQFIGQAERRVGRARAHLGDEDPARPRHEHVLRREGTGHAIHAEGEPHGRGVRAAQGLDQTVVAAAGPEGVLRPQTGGRHLKNRSGVVIQPAHQPGGRREGQFGGPQQFENAPVMGPAIGAQMVGRDRGVGQGRSVPFAVQNAQRVDRQPALAIFAQAGFLGLQIGAQGVSKSRTAHGAPQGVDPEGGRALGQAGGRQNVPHEEQGFGVGLGRSVAEKLAARLTEFPVPAGLGPLRPKHGAAVEKFFHRRALVPGVLQIGAHHAGGALGAQRQGAPAPVLENVHLLFNDVGGVAHRPAKEIDVFKNGRAQFFVPVKAEAVGGPLFDAPEQPDFVAEQVPGAPGRRGTAQKIFPMVK
jgi:hypothetical protein